LQRCAVQPHTPQHDVVAVVQHKPQAQQNHSTCRTTAAATKHKMMCCNVAQQWPSLPTASPGQNVHAGAHVSDLHKCSTHPTPPWLHHQPAPYWQATITLQCTQGSCR
jgi:hypothetical protein